MPVQGHQGACQQRQTGPEARAQQHPPANWARLLGRVAHRAGQTHQPDPPQHHDQAGQTQWQSQASFHTLGKPLVQVAEQGVAEAEAIQKGLEEKSREFVEKGAEVYAKA